MGYMIYSKNIQQLEVYLTLVFIENKTLTTNLVWDNHF